MAGRMTDASELDETSAEGTEQVEAEQTPKPRSEFTSLELRNITQEFRSADGNGTLRIIEDVTLHFEKPSINMLLGPSGCGKSTLLRMMGGVRPIGTASPTSGEVRIGGTPCHGPHNDSVMVFQRYANRPDLTVRENVAFPFKLKLWRSKIDRKQAHERVDEMLDAVGLAEKAALRPAQLSGGQNQRVALARALVLPTRDPPDGRTLRCPRRPNARRDAGPPREPLGTPKVPRCIRHARRDRGATARGPRHRVELSACTGCR